MKAFSDGGVMPKTIPVLFLGIVLSVFVHCGGKGSSSSAVALKGSLSQTDYAYSDLSPAGRLWAALVEGFTFAAAVPITEIWGLRTYNGEFHPSVFSYVKKSTPSGGSFNIELDTNDWVVLLINGNASDKKDQVVGYVTMTAGSNGLTGLPLGGATGAVDLGTLTKNGEETSSTRTSSDNASTLSLTAAQLESLAASDEGIKTVKNAYRNWDGTTFLSIKPFHVWYWSGSLSAISNAYSSVSTLVNSKYRGYLFYMNSNHSAINYSSICNQSLALQLVPPSTVTNVSGNGTWTPTSPLDSSIGSRSTSGSNSCGAGNLYLRDDTASYGSYQFNFSAQGSQSSDNEYLGLPIPSGDWTLRVGSTVIGKFEANIGTPFAGNIDTTRPIIFIPSLKANVTGSTVSSVEVKWYLRNSTTGSFDEVTDSTLLGKMSTPIVSFTDYNISSAEEMGTLAATSGASYTPKSSYTITSTGLSIAVTYTKDNTSYRFDFRPSAQ